MDKITLDEILLKHKKWLRNEEGGEHADLRNADLSYADLRGSDLRYSDLRYADLRYADIDYSVWPLWCGAQNVKVDERILYQLLAHICVLDCDSDSYKKIRKYLLPYARKSHRAKELGLICHGHTSPGQA